MESKSTTVLCIALANYDPRELWVEQQYIQEHSPLVQCVLFRTGRSLLEALRAGQNFAVIVLGSQLEDMDSLELIRQLRQLETKPPLLMFDEGGRRGSAARRVFAGGDLNADALRRIELAQLVEEVDRLLHRYPQQTSPAFELHCQKMFDEWGVSRMYAGSSLRYFTRALCIACATAGQLAIRKEILNKVAEQCSVSVAAVDSGIRRMIDDLEVRLPDGWCAFKQKYGFEERRPTTGKLIYAAKQYLLENIEP